MGKQRARRHGRGEARPVRNVLSRVDGPADPRWASRPRVQHGSKRARGVPLIPPKLAATTRPRRLETTQSDTDVSDVTRAPLSAGRAGLTQLTPSPEMSQLGGERGGAILE